MKHFYSLLVTLSLSIIGSAQAPQGFNYQAVIRDGGGEIIANDLVSVRFTLHQADANGTTVYQETHTPTTNEFGLVNLVIGQGLVNSGIFTDINWSSELHFLQVEVNPGGGFVDLGTQQLMSVPYALSSMETVHAWGTSGNAGTDTTLNFIGTTDNVPLVFKINNEKAGLIDGNFQDIYLGYQAGNSQSIQYQGYEGSNVGIGCQALYSLDFGWGNVGVGKGALFTQDGGAWNVAIGAYAGNLNQNGHDNCVIGAASLHDNTIGNNNTAVGRSALGGNVAGSGGTAVGAYAMLYANSTSSEFNNRNVAVGFEALRGSNTSADNTGN
ncbi:MAG: hypothetical protein JNM00_09470, partial [Flavobacteriales bacterium]|nr:hypothetical protein [Flavobacteriales bacterium]